MTDETDPLAVALTTIVTLEAQVAALERALGVIALSLAGGSKPMTERIVGGMQAFAAQSRREGRPEAAALVYERLAESLHHGQTIVAEGSSARTPGTPRR